jgi:hypothetical protein
MKKKQKKTENNDCHVGDESVFDELFILLLNFFPLAR